MFYETQPELVLRFGDIITGLVDVIPILDNLSTDAQESYQIEFRKTKYFSVMSPCCSIDNQILSITPIQKIQFSLANNSFLLEDFSKINRFLDPEKAVPDGVWEKLPFEKKEKLLISGKTYAFLDIFVYCPNGVLEEYTFKTKQKRDVKTGYYMIDFKKIYYISSKQINRGQDHSIIKKLQLTIESRKELRDKLTAYFSRVPDEDKV